ncbi:nucleoside triphosphate pyrophosphohydrolase family protein [Chromobacterium alkanivorans]|uniref:nucleoside triphosphate pyrophosphohydrolase family protein n=1 Tax=Chromobacterium alkanivorans TaxID=1071719 RepID=UPI0019681451|nr:nucleoside triphosphate pyrophosphohydrolase family protein [Chromobacterium alkanivorans]MBN3005302.1 nucleoside triphosphate pyrophosphohydrolase family protein [Chromobacterium alkanivorans]
MENFFALRRQFMHQFDIPSPQRPQWQPQQLAMWETMLGEELAEFQQALADYKRQDGDEAERARRMAELLAEGVDVLNVLSGLLMSQGLPLEDMFREIHAANMRKCVDGKIVRREDGKVLKPAGWQPADKEGVIRRALEF